MKHIGTLLLITLLCSDSLFGQAKKNCDNNKIYDIIIDFNHGNGINVVRELSEKNHIKEGGYYRLKIRNINLNLYSVKVNHADSIISKKIETPGFGDLPVDALSALVGGLGGSVAVPVSNDEMELINLAYENGLNARMTETEIKKMLSKVADSILTGQKLIDVNNNIKELSDKDIFLFQIKQYDFFAQNKINELQTISNTIDSMKLKAYQQIIAYETPDTPDVDYIAYEDIISQVQMSRNEIRIIYDATFAKRNDIQKLPVPEGVDKKLKEEVLNKYNGILETITKMRAVLNADNTYKLIQPLAYMKGKKNTTYYSAPMQFNGERAVLEYSIIPRDEKYRLQSYSSQIIFPKRPNIYVTVGLSGFRSSLFDEEYSLVGDSTTGFGIAEEDYAEYEIGITSLIRYGMKVTQNHNIGLHLALGPGITFSDDIKPRLLFGGGFSYGKKHMLALDFGGIAGSVQKLSATQNVGDRVAEASTDVTVDRLEVGWFVSFGYHFNF